METDLASKTVQVQSKRFYLDVKQNRRGRFIKIAELGLDGRRTQIFLAMAAASQFRDCLSSFGEFYASLGPGTSADAPKDGKLKSETFVKDKRRYYVDLKENSRGRFLRVAQTIIRGGPRSQIAIPAQGIIEFRDALTNILDEFDICDENTKDTLPESRQLHVDGKTFYFDVGENKRGVFMRLSEVKGNFRNSLNIPEKGWSKISSILSELSSEMKNCQRKYEDRTEGETSSN